MAGEIMVDRVIRKKIDALVEKALGDEKVLLRLIDEVHGCTLGDWLADEIERIGKYRIECLYDELAA